MKSKKLNLKINPINLIQNGRQFLIIGGKASDNCTLPSGCDGCTGEITNKGCDKELAGVNQ